MVALVRVLKFFNVNNDWWSFSNNEVRHRGAVEKPTSANCRTSVSCSYRFPVYMCELLADKFDVESSSTLGTVSKELHK